MPEMITGPTLAEVMERRQLSMEELLRWAPSIAGSIEELHVQGRCHGEVSATRVRIAGRNAVLMPGSKAFETEKQPQDIAQFAAMLKTMLQRAQVESDAERAHWRVLDRIATTNANAAEGSRMKKVTAALKLVNPRGRTGLLERSAAVETEPGGVEAVEKPKLRRVMMLVRETSKDAGPPAPHKLPKVYARTLHIWAYFATAVGIAVTACIFYLKCGR